MCAKNTNICRLIGSVTEFITLTCRYLTKKRPKRSVF